jgi:exodeoxyribonuclease V alpha subunit
VDAPVLSPSLFSDKTYGADAVRLVSENPTVSRDVRGIGFRTADQIAARLGIE